MAIAVLSGRLLEGPKNCSKISKFPKEFRKIIDPWLIVEFLQYVCWAFARAYDPIELQPYVEEIANALLVVAVFDREVNCRRAASAAFQENVGRQGQFPHGIEIVTMVDYFSVGNRTYCYTDLAVKLAKFDEYSKNLIDHVSNVKVAHWDEEIRISAADALKQFVLLNPSYLLESILPALVDLTNSNDLL